MDAMKVWIIFGMTVGALAGVFALCRWLIRRWESGADGCDERQGIARGKAGRVAFLFLMAYLVGFLILRLLGLSITDEALDAALWLGLLLGGAVYSTIAVWMDAWLGLYKKWKNVVIALVAAAAVLLWDYLDGVIWMRGLFLNQSPWLGLIAGVFCLYLALLLTVRMRPDGEE